MYSLRRLVRQPARTIAALAGVALAVGLIASVAAFVDGSAGLMTTRALAPVTVDLQAVLSRPLATDAPTLDFLRTKIAATPGVGVAAPFASLDLNAGAISAGGNSLSGPTKLFAFDSSYPNDFPLVQLTSGAASRGAALLSTEAASALNVTPGDRIRLALPGSAPLDLSVGGIANFRNAGPLFGSRAADTQGEFAYVPNVIALDLQTFTTAVLPALRADAASGNPVLRTSLVLEVQVRTDPARYATLDPAAALASAQGLRRTIERIVPGEVRVLDNIAAALTAARGDSVLAKIMFLFLGTPGVLLAAYIASYSAGLVAAADRREIGLLRARGAGAGHLRRLLAVEALVVGVFGAISGLLVSAAVLTTLFGTPFPPGATGSALAISAAIASAAGLIMTGLATYLPRRLALGRDVAEERRDMAPSRPPIWLRLRFDFVLIALAVAVESVTLVAGGFRPTAAEGQSLSLSFYTLLAPLLLWIGLTLLLVRVVLVLLRRSDRGPGSPFGSVVGGLARRGLARRNSPFSAGLIALALTVAFGTSLALFIATYDAHQRTDARLVLGGDLRVTPSTAVPRAVTDSSWLAVVPGVSEATGVLQINDALVGNDKRALVAIDPMAFGRVAMPPDAFFVDQTAGRTLTLLQADPNAVLVSDELARTFNILPGDNVMLRLTRIDGTLVQATLHAVGEFKNFPGFPQGIDLVAVRPTVASLTGRNTADFFVLRSVSSDSSITDAATALRARPDASSLQVQTVAEAYSQDQSTLAALNLSGLSRIVSVFTVLMSAAAAAIFIAATFVARRKEFTILRALGLDPMQVRGLLAVEGALLVVVALAVGIAVGIVTATLDVQILAPLFLVPPLVPDAAGTGRVAVLAAFVVLAAAASIAVGSSLVARLRPAEILREE